MSPRQIIVLVVAAIAAIGALLVIRGMGAARPAAETPAASIAGQQVLVAARDLPQGAALAPGDLAVALFPTNSVSAQFIRVDQQPSAQSQMVGSVTRRPFAQGEPITMGSVVAPDGRSFLAAELQPGFRAVSVEVQQKEAVGGYIQPNDHVDVIATVRDNSGGSQQVHSAVVLTDVRVLALGDVTQPQNGGDHPTRNDAQIAVLELSPDDARTLALADGMGDISLALRGVQAETVGLHTSQNSGGFNEAGSVKVHSFGSVAGGGR